MTVIILEIGGIMRRIGCVIICFCVLVNPLIGQIVIDWTEVPHAIGVEFAHNGTDSVDVVIGPGGGPYEWYFMQPAGTQNTNSLIVPRAATPYGDSFPTANLVLEITEDSDTVYAYADLQPTAGVNLGYGVAVATETLCVYFSPVDSYPLPLVYGNSRSFYYGHTIHMTPVISVRTDVHGYEVIDGYGTATIPYGTFDCLRTCSYDTTVSTLIVNNIPVTVDTSTRIIYDFMTEDYGLVAHVVSFPEETNPNFTEAMFLERLASFSSAVTEQSASTVFGNIPAGGIFSHAVTLPITLGRSGRVSFSVYNSNGRRVWSEERVLREGAHVLVWDGCENGMRAPAGVYFYRIATDTGMHTGKAILLR
jgi:hypothetical protein